MAEIALLFVPQIVRHVDTPTDCVLVKQDGWVLTAQENVYNHMERIVSSLVITALIKHVTDLTEAVCLVVWTEKPAI